MAFIYLLLCGLIAYWAHTEHKSWILYLALSLFLSPLVGAAILKLTK